MNDSQRLSQDGLKAINSLPPHYRPRQAIRQTPDGQRALQSLPPQYHPRRIGKAQFGPDVDYYIERIWLLGSKE